MSIEEFAALVEAELAPSYDLVYVDYRDELTEDQVAVIARGDNLWETKAGERLSEYESEATWNGACDVVDGLSKDVARREDVDLDDLEWDASDDRNYLIEQVCLRESGAWYKQIASQTPAVLMRVCVADEDHSFSFEAVEAERVLTQIGAPVNEHNVREVNYALDNASPEFSVVLGYLIFAVSVLDLWDLPVEGGKVKVTNPHLWLGSPFSGSGYCTDNALEAEFIIDRADLRTDKDAFGYGWAEVCGGVTTSMYEADIALVEETK